MLNIGRLLSRFGNVSFVVVSSHRQDEEAACGTEHGPNIKRIMRPSPIAKGSALRRFRDRLRHELDPGYLETDPCVVSPADRAALLDLMQEHDLTWIHSIRTANLFRISRWPSSILDVDDIPSRWDQSAAASGTDLTRRLLDLRMSWIWRRRERLLAQRFDVLTVCSEDDRRYLGSRSPIHVIPNGFHPQPVRPRAPSQLPTVGFIGTFDWGPNEQGARWFIRDVWPLIKQEFPHAQLRLVGWGSDGYLTKLGPDIVGLGWLENPGDEIASWSAFIVPIKVGGGTRIKIAEGFARKCPVVATTIGAFGYDVHNGEEILLADRAADFASACITLLRNPELAEALSERAHKRFLQRWTWDSFEGAVRTVVEECLAVSAFRRTGGAVMASAIR